MGACVSQGPAGMSDEEKIQHREAEKQLKDAKAKMEHQVKVCRAFYSHSFIADEQ